MNKDNIKNEIMALIKDEKVEIKSKWKFILHSYLRLLFIAILGLFSIYVVSLIAFISRTPPELLLFIAAVLIGLYLLLVNQDKLSSIPRIYIWLLVLLVIALFSYIINRLHMHERMMRDRYIGRQVKFMYRHYKPELFPNEIKVRL